MIAAYLEERYQLAKEKGPRTFPEAIERRMEEFVLNLPGISKYQKQLAKAGCTEPEIRMLLEAHVLQPLRKLGTHQDRGLVSTSSYGVV